MQIEKDKVVTFHYSLIETGGDALETSVGRPPLVFLHGHGGMLKGVEDALEGKQPGDKVVVSLGVDEAYGPRQEDAIHRVSINHVLRDSKNQKFKKGQIVHLNTEHGPRPVVVAKVGLKMLDVDTNHPYAGKALTYDIEVVDVRDATPEELDHGHVHGEGGVHH